MGIDPSAARKQQKLMALDATANTFEAVAREWFEKHSAGSRGYLCVPVVAVERRKLSTDRAAMIGE
jgi:hypothetical protein